MGLDDPRVIMWFLGGNAALAAGIVSRMMTEQRKSRELLNELRAQMAVFAVQMDALRRDLVRVEGAKRNNGNL